MQGCWCIAEPLTEAVPIRGFTCVLLSVLAQRHFRSGHVS